MLTEIGLTPGGSSTVHIYTQTIHRTTQLTTLVGRHSGIRTQSGQTKIDDECRTILAINSDYPPCRFKPVAGRHNGNVLFSVGKVCLMRQRKPAVAESYQVFPWFSSVLKQMLG